MTKVVTYLFDNMFQGTRKVSLREKMIVVGIMVVLITSTLYFIF